MLSAHNFVDPWLVAFDPDELWRPPRRTAPFPRVSTAPECKPISDVYLIELLIGVDEPSTLRRRRPDLFFPTQRLAELDHQKGHGPAPDPTLAAVIGQLAVAPLVAQHVIGHEAAGLPFRFCRSLGNECVAL